jgi:hypothetical protein
MDSEDTLMGSRDDREVRTRNPGLIIQALVADLRRNGRVNAAQRSLIGKAGRFPAPSGRLRGRLSRRMLPVAAL